MDKINFMVYEFGNAKLHCVAGKNNLDKIMMCLDKNGVNDTQMDEILQICVKNRIYGYIKLKNKESLQICMKFNDVLDENELFINDIQFKDAMYLSEPKKVIQKGWITKEELIELRKNSWWTDKFAI